MRLDALGNEIRAHFFTLKDVEAEIEHVCGSDRISELLNGAGERTLMVTGLAGAPLVRVAELMDVPAICLVNGVWPGRDVVAAAAERGIALLVSPVGLFETCGRLERRLAAESGGAR